MALVFLPAADIPTFVGEGRVDLGITGRDQVAEHEATSPGTKDTGVEEVLDLGFGRCRLQVQVPEKGNITEAKQLVGKNIVTSFVGLTEKYFDELEGLGMDKGVVNGDGPRRNTLKTKIKYVGGSVEAACALGLADGIVDLVGQTYILPLPSCHGGLTKFFRVWGNDESGRSESDRYRGREHSSPHQVKAPIQPKASGSNCIPN